jgi:signal transduction histidine kinase
VEQRTAELKHSNSELDQFAYVASHDLKAPLRAISLLATWIDDDAGALLPSGSKEHLAKLQGRVRRMETLLSDLLAYSRVGRQRHPSEQVNMKELVNDVTELLSPPAGFTVKICGELPVMEVERIPLVTVFRNLLGNAIKHHHRVHQGCAKISALCQEEYVEFAVTDDGPGIAPEYHRRIFEIFQTLAPRDQVEGSGIGLAIVKKSVESRGGKIWVESAQGEGTAFHFTWPQNSHVAKTPA